LPSPSSDRSGRPLCRPSARSARGLTSIAQDGVVGAGWVGGRSLTLAAPLFWLPVGVSALAGLGNPLVDDT